MDARSSIGVFIDFAEQCYSAELESLSPVGLNAATKGQVKCRHPEEVAEVMKD